MSNLGEILRSARQKRNLTLTEAAEATRIKSHFLEALEDGNFSVLPGPAYVTGFLRNYARFLDLHPDDVVQEYYAARPMPVPSVKPATRVLASGFERNTRKRVLWALAVVAALLVGGYVIKQYADTRASAQGLPVTPSNLGGQLTTTHRQPPPALVHLQLRATQPAFVRVKVDGVLQFDGVLRARTGIKSWSGHTLYIASLDGPYVELRLAGQHWRLLGQQPGLAVDVATSTGLKSAL